MCGADGVEDACVCSGKSQQLSACSIIIPRGNIFWHMGQATCPLSLMVLLACLCGRTVKHAVHEVELGLLIRVHTLQLHS